MPFCPNCGKEILSSDRFCPNCGAVLQQPQETPPTPPPTPPVTPPPPAPSIKKGIGKGGKLLSVVGFVLMSASSFLPWITASAPLVGTISRTGMELSPEAGILSVVFLILGSLMVWFYKNLKRCGVACVAMGGLMFVEFMYGYNEIQGRLETLKGTLAIGSAGTGLYLLGIGAVVTIIGGISLFFTPDRGVHNYFYVFSPLFFWVSLLGLVTPHYSKSFGLVAISGVW